MATPPDFIGQHELKLSVRLQNQRDFEALYRRYWRPLYDYARAKTGDGDAAEELVQALFVTLWEKRETLQIGNLQAYLFTALRNRIIDHYQQTVFAELDSIADPAATEYASFLDELETALREAVAQLEGPPPRFLPVGAHDQPDRKQPRLAHSPEPD